MNNIALFRSAALGSLALGFAGALVDFLPRMVPETVVSAIEATLLPGQLFPVAVAGIVLGLVGLVATIGLVLFEPWSRPLALVSTVAGVVLYPTMPPMVQSGWASMFFYLSALTWGASLVMAYYAPLISERFARDS